MSSEFPRPTRSLALETFVARYVENAPELLAELARMTVSRLGLSYMEGPVHVSSFDCYCRLKPHASHVYARDNHAANLVVDLALVLKALIEHRTWIAGEPEVVASVEVSEEGRAIKVELTVDYLKAVRTSAP